jgi:histidyl-tRNA synthetase
VDILGGDPVEADLEILLVAIELLKDFGATKNQYSLRISHRDLLKGLYESWQVVPDIQVRLNRMVDRRLKMNSKQWDQEVKEIIPDHFEEFNKLLNSGYEAFEKTSPEAVKHLQKLFNRLPTWGVGANFDLSIVRGLDYYTGLVFEIFDEHPEHTRAMFGGGRYDGLMDLFGKPSVSGVGFGMGDVTFQSFLENHGLGRKLLPNIQGILYAFPDVSEEPVVSILNTLRSSGLNVQRDLTKGKLSKIFENADKQHLSFVVIVGVTELLANKILVKDLRTKEQFDVKISDLIHLVDRFSRA